MAAVRIAAALAVHDIAGGPGGVARTVAIRRFGRHEGSRAHGCPLELIAMEQNRLKAYRLLIYAAMLDIRPIEWFWYRGLRRFLPFVSRRERAAVQRSGALADWLHNLAMYSAVEFRDFDEETFWRDHEAICVRYPRLGFEGYRRMFDSWVSMPESEWPGVETWANLKGVIGK